MQKNKLLIALSVAVLLLSCDGKKVFDQYTSIENNQWETQNKLAYKINIDDTVHTNDLYLNLRNTNDYPYSNLFMFLTITDPTGKYKTDTLELQLANDKGKWLGKGIGSVFLTKVLLLHNFRFEHTGIYQVDVEQAMRSTTLDGITDVGIRIERK